MRKKELNVFGIRKKRLDRERSTAIRSMTFRNWLLESREERQGMEKCIKAIDEANRRLNRNDRN